jgi:hypothetical protein
MGSDVIIIIDMATMWKHIEERLYYYYLTLEIASELPEISLN